MLSEPVKGALIRWVRSGLSTFGREQMQERGDGRYWVQALIEHAESPTELQENPDEAAELIDLELNSQAKIMDPDVLWSIRMAVRDTVQAMRKAGAGNIVQETFQAPELVSHLIRYCLQSDGVAAAAAEELADHRAAAELAVKLAVEEELSHAK